MPNFENPSINKIFENRKDFIPEVGEQLEKEIKAEIEINRERINVDYRVISVESQENKEGNAVVLLPGFGSGWEGISELGFSLACEGRKVIMPSLPGYGNSDNPSENYYKTNNFDNEAEVINQLISQIGLKEGAKVHLVGHSMGSEIMATFAQKYPDKVSSLVLLNPAGINDKENKFSLGGRFIGSGIKTSAEYSIHSAFSGEKDYEKEIWKHIPKTESPFAKGRGSQRLSEVDRLSEGHLLEKIKNTKCPITYISGQMDTVYPPGKEDDENSQLARVIESVGDKTRIEKSVMAGLRHNTTIAPDEITAANIDHYLEKAEKPEHIPTSEEVLLLFEKIIGENKYEEVRKLEDERGLYLWEIKIPQEDGSSIEYSYTRKGNYKERGLPGGSALETAIHITYFDNDGVPISGTSVAKIIDGKWKDTP
jgi:pimeloyl-ACP methyl ester carboxylesterase